MLSNAALAVEDSNIILSEDFAELPNQELAYPPSYNSWVLSNCTYGTQVTEILKIERSSSNHNIAGYASTPKLSYSGDVLLSFSYATQSNNKYSTYKISLSSGTFEENGSSNITKTIHNSYIDNLKTISYKINNFTNNTRITFTQEKYNNEYVTYFLDDVSVTKDGMTLDESIDNAPWITGNKNEIITVKTVRTLKANIWNTLCLPFDVNKDLLEATFDTNVELRVFDEYDDATYTMKFKTPENNSIAAGTPFLIKVNEDIVNPTFTGVTISDVSAQANGNDGVSFVGTYSPVELNTDGTNLFITTVNELAKPTSTGNKMPGLRAYIVVPKNFNSSARLFLDDEATAINNIGTQKATNSVTLYNLQGQRVERPRSGLYIKNNKLTIIR